MDHKAEAIKLIEHINAGDTANGVDALFEMKSTDAHEVLIHMRKLLKKADGDALVDAVMARALVRSSYVTTE